MKLAGVIGTTILCLTLGASSAAYAQDQHDPQEEQKDKPAQEKEKRAQPEKPAKQEEKNAQEEKNTKPEEKNAQEEKNTRPEEKNAKQDQQRAPEAKPEQQAQRASGNGGRIPADRYKANFGREHTFRVSQGDYSNGRFQYGGYWFGFAGAWPSNWLYTQDLFVVEIDGVYYLCNPMYPGVNLAINVTL